MRIERFAEGVTLYCGDCREVLPTIGNVDAVVTDPPYGIDSDLSMHKAGGNVVGYGHRAVAKREYEYTEWDRQTADEAINASILISSYQIIFGGNYYKLPPTRCWLVWDKQNDGNRFADCELAWTNLKKPVRQIHHLWNGMARKNSEYRFDHPTQKPVDVMKWCISQLPLDCRTVFDPFMGTGTTGVAAISMGMHFTGIEIEEKYFDIACKRIANTSRQKDLFIDFVVPEEKQMEWSDMWAKPFERPELLG